MKPRPFTLLRALQRPLNILIDGVRWLGHRSLNYPRQTLAVVGIASTVLVLPLPTLQPYLFEDSALPQSSEQLQALRSFLEDFGSQEAAFVAFDCGHANCTLEPGSLDAIETITERLRAADPKHIRSVTSLITLSEIATQDDYGLTARPIVRRDAGEWPNATALRARIESRAEPTLRSYVATDDYQTALFLIRMDLFLRTAPRPEGLPPHPTDQLTPAEAMEGRTALVHRLADAVSELERDTNVSGTLMLTGPGVDTVMNTEDYIASSSIIVPASIATMCLLLFLVFRKVAGVVTPLLTVGIPTLWAFGMYSWTGNSPGLLIPLAPTLLIVIGVTDAVHLISHYFTIAPEHQSAKEALHQTVDDEVRPCVLTTVTTVAAFSSLTLSDLTTVSEFGIVGAVGGALALLFSFSLLPILLLRADAPKGFQTGRPSRWTGRLLAAFSHVTTKHSLPIIGIATVVVVLFASQVPNVNVSIDPASVMDPEATPAMNIRKMESLLGSSHTLEIVLNAHSDDGFRDPRNLAAAHALAESVQADPRVMSVIGVDDYLQWSADEFTRQQSASPDLLASREGIAQLLLLAESVDRDALRQWITSDARQVRLSLRSKKYIGPTVWKAIMTRIEQEASNILPQDITITLTGATTVMVLSTDEVVRTLVWSFGLSFAIVALMMVLWTGSVRTGLLCMIPNAVPAIVALGTLAFLDINLDVATVVIASLIIGIAVDDTIHWVDAYLESTREAGDHQAATAFAFRKTGQPIFFTSAVLVIGFYVWHFSPVPNVSHFGLVTALGIATALIADFLVLPAVFSVTDRTAHIF